MTTGLLRLDPSDLDANELECLLAFLSNATQTAFQDAEGNSIQIPSEIQSYLGQILTTLQEGKSVVTATSRQPDDRSSALEDLTVEVMEAGLYEGSFTGTTR